MRSIRSVSCFGNGGAGGADVHASPPPPLSLPPPPLPSPPLPSPLPPPVAVLIWDLENVRLPDGVDPGIVVQAVKRRFMDRSFFAERRSLACVTPSSLHAMLARCPGLVDALVPFVDLALASPRNPKRGADYVLCRELAAFLDSRPPRGSRIVLLTGDGDFLGPVQRALRTPGIEVQLVYYAEGVAKSLLSLDYGIGQPSPVDWRAFLEKDGGVGGPVVLPYPLRLIPSPPIKQRRDARAKTSRGVQTQTYLRCCTNKTVQTECATTAIAVTQYAPPTSHAILIIDDDDDDDM